MEETLTKPLHPDHLADLKQSGLTEETIREAGIYTVCPGDIPRKLGFDSPRIESLLTFPYGDGFERYKIFPSYKDKDGHTVKYLQRKETPARLYIPPQVQAVVKDPKIDLAICEGEKKTLRLIQEGLHAIGIGGIWSWSQNGHAISDIEKITWKDRRVNFFPDSDVWQKEDLLKAVYALTKKLEERGARVVIYKLPGQGENKMGVDDFLQQDHNLKDLLALPTTTIEGPEFNTDIRTWHVAREVRKADNPLTELEAVFKKHFALEDFTPMKVILAVVVANLADGDPVWLLLVGPPSSLKSEFIQSLKGLGCVYPISLLTPRTFASGDKTTKDASLLEQLPDRTVLTMKDFGSVLQMRRDDRSEVLASLREIYDGSYTKNFGNGKRVVWTGKLGIIAGATGIVDEYHSVHQILGERFLIYRLDDYDRTSATKKALQNAGEERRVRQEISEAVNAFFKTLNSVPTWTLGKYTDKLVALSDFVTRARTGTLRDGYTRELIYIPEWEGPARFAKQLHRLAYGLSCLTGESGLSQENYKIIFSVAENSLPRLRRDVLSCLLSNDSAGIAEEIAGNLGHPERVIYRTLEDLEVLKVIKHTKPLYRIAEDTKSLLDLATP